MSAGTYLLRWPISRPPAKDGDATSASQNATESILKAQRNFWRKQPAARVGFVIDASAFYRAFYEAASCAQKQIFIIGWDTDSRAELLVGGECPTAEPLTLKKFLRDLCDERPELRVYILSWDFNIIYSLEREAFPDAQFDSIGHERVRFVLDNTHPPLGSHHQKVVVIDDAIAFSGGLDICARRWDTPEHLAHDPRRVDPWGKTYGPFHDVQIAVDGSAAHALGDLARERWWRATGERVATVLPQERMSACWPPSLRIDLHDVDVAISRTIPAFGGRKSVREVERLFLDSIAKARHFIFFEAQYFSSRRIARAMARRLREVDGPEIIMVIPRDATGWIEESTMSVLRGRVLEIVRKSDHYQRFHVYIPIVPNLTKGYVKVHSKVTVVDDEFVRIGSANLNQRSMGLDTECDISLESNGEPRVRAAIASLRARLLAEHLDVSPEEFEECFQRTGSLGATIELLRGRPRTLVEFSRHVPEWLDILIPASEVLDPSGPYRFSGGFRRYFPNFFTTLFNHRRVPWIGRFKIISFLLILILLLLAWRFTPLAEWIKPERISGNMELIHRHPLAPLIVMVIFVIGGLLMIPLTAMIVATALTFAPLEAFFLCLGGTVASAAVTFWLGSRFGATRLSRLSSDWLVRVKEKIVGGGWLAMTVVRLIPVAPFTVVNLVAGSMRMSFVDYAIGTVAGAVPGILALTILAERIGSTFATPDFYNIFLLSVFILAAIAAMRLLKYFLADRYS